jgi:chromosome segregation protein
MHDPHVGSLGDYGVAFEAVPGVVLQRLLARHPVADVLEGEPVVPAVDRRRGLMPARGVLELGTDAASAAEIVFRLRRQADDARVKLEGCQARASGAEEAVREMERQLESAMQLRSALRDELESARLRLDQNRRAVAEARRDAEQAENAEARIRAEIDSIEGRQEDLQELGETLAREIETSGIQIRQLEQQVDHAQTLASALQDESQRAGDLLSDARLQVSRLQEQLRLNQDLVARLERTSREVTGRLALLRQEAESTRKRAAELDARLSRDIEGRAEAEALRIASEEQLARLREKFDVVAAGLRDADADILAQRKTMETAQEALRGQEFAAERSRAELEVIEQTLAERFQTGIEQARELAIAGGMTDALRSELVALNASIEKLGPVNPAAEEEYEEARERHAFMGGQRADLETALGDLESAIRKMDKTSRDLFEETFHAVNQRFQEVFPLLFNGGKARMELTDPDNLLETGVDIIVQPPGKRLQSMTLLSGGEKALSAVALIFAIFQLRPTPFCILDEVDAPLDEANVIRFAELVQRMAGTSQFMIITHNKRTMEAAHTLYGVTMEEPGVSKIVGVRLPSRDTPLT